MQIFFIVKSFATFVMRTPKVEKTFGVRITKCMNKIYLRKAILLALFREDFCDIEAELILTEAGLLLSIIEALPSKEPETIPL